MEMKNVIKKIASIAMAFTLLGTGTAVTKTISPKSSNTLVASAGNSEKTCHCKTGRKYGTGNYKYDIKKVISSCTFNGIKGKICRVDKKECINCANCGNLYAYKTILSNELYFVDNNERIFIRIIIVNNNPYVKV